MVKNLPTSTGDKGSIPASGRALEGENSNPLQYSCWENPMDRGAWRATVHRVAKSHIQLSKKTEQTKKTEKPCALSLEGLVG